MINEKNIPSSQEETARQQSFIQLAKALTEQKIKTLGRPPVSYTHLDVYKRQAYRAADLASGISGSQTDPCICRLQS